MNITSFNSKESLERENDDFPEESSVSIDESLNMKTLLL